MQGVNAFWLCHTTCPQKLSAYKVLKPEETKINEADAAMGVEVLTMDFATFVRIRKKLTWEAYEKCSAT